MTMTLDQMVRERDALAARVREAERLLRDLCVWAEWIRARRRTPTMDEPNTGALAAAGAFLAPSPGDAPNPNPQQKE